uniref:CMD domain-containing protein n=1 Tax=Panagrellus redivivus TaxID=6233 RepID=A0A7E4VN87_PANRE
MKLSMSDQMGISKGDVEAIAVMTAVYKGCMMMCIAIEAAKWRMFKRLCLLCCSSASRVPWPRFRLIR